MVPGERKTATERNGTMGKLTGKVAVVTGGNSGIGLSTAQSFIEEGAKVAIFGRNQETLDQARESLGDNAIAVKGDVTSPADLERLFGVTRETFGPVDVVFANAGVAEFAPIDAADEDHFDRMIDINFKGAFFTLQKALPALNETASVILTTSVVNEIGLPATSVYSAAKAALRSLARTATAELGPRGIRVNAIAPGLTETPLLGKMGLPEEQVHGFGEQVVEQTPLSRLGRPKDIANTVVFLASDDSAYVAGAEFAVDGGFAQT